MTTLEEWMRLAETQHTEPAVDEVVTRWVDWGPVTVDEALPHWADNPERVALGRGAELQLDADFERAADPHVPTWHAPGRLVWPDRRLMRVAHIEIDVTAWSEDKVEVSVRPAGRRVLSWGPRRERRYFDAAHRAATRVAAVVATPAA